MASFPGRPESSSSPYLRSKEPNKQSAIRMQQLQLFVKQQRINARPRSLGLIPCRARDNSLLHRIPSGSGMHSFSFIIVFGGSLDGSKATDAEVYLPSKFLQSLRRRGSVPLHSIFLHDKRTKNFLFTFKEKI
jgi:hypothetical protein